MAKTNAERQAEYRQRHYIGGERDLVRLSISLTPETKTKLEMLAGRFHISQRKLIEELIDGLYSKVQPRGGE